MSIENREQQVDQLLRGIYRMCVNRDDCRDCPFHITKCTFGEPRPSTWFDEETIGNKFSPNYLKFTDKDIVIKAKEEASEPAQEEVQAASQAASQAEAKAEAQLKAAKASAIERLEDYAGAKALNNASDDEKAVYKDAVDAVLCGNAELRRIYYRVRKPDCSYVAVSTRGFVLCDSEGKPEYFGGIIIPQ